jgi:hypothetical protein
MIAPPRSALLVRPSSPTATPAATHRLLDRLFRLVSGPSYRQAWAPSCSWARVDHQLSRDFFVFTANVSADAASPVRPSSTTSSSHISSAPPLPPCGLALAGPRQHHAARPWLPSGSCRFMWCSVAMPSSRCRSSVSGWRRRPSMLALWHWCQSVWCSSAACMEHGAPPLRRHRVLLVCLF